MAVVAILKHLFAVAPRLIVKLPPPPIPEARGEVVCYVFQLKPRENFVLMKKKRTS
jgi:hypothetical protein